MDRVISHVDQKKKKSPEEFHYVRLKAGDEDRFCLKVIDKCVSAAADQLEVCEHSSVSESLSCLIGH